MRKSALIIIGVIIVIAILLAWFVRDRLFENALESGLEMVAGAKVEIDGFHFSTWGLNSSWNRLQIADKADPWKNIIETGHASFDIEGRPLFWKKFIIHEMRLENVRSGTARTSDGSLPPEPPDTTAETSFIDNASASLQEQLGDLPILDLGALGKKLKVDSLINVQNLMTVQKYESLKVFTDSSLQYWEAQLKPATYQARLQKLETEFKALNLNLDQAKDVATLTMTLNKLNEMYKEVMSLKKDIEEKYTGATNLVNDLKTQLADLKGAIKDDIAKAQELAKLKDMDVRDISLLLFGQPLVGKVDEVLGYVKLGRKYLPTAQKVFASKKEPAPPRFKGQDIHFPFHYRYPRFLLRLARLSGANAAGDTARAYFFEGELRGLTNEPRVFARPTQFNLDLARDLGNKYHLAGSLDHTGETAFDTLWASARDFGLGKLNLKSSRYFPQAIEANKGDISFTGYFIEDRIAMNLDLAASPVNFIFAETQNAGTIAKIVQNLIVAITDIKLNAQFNGESPKYQLKLNSNIDDILTQKVSSLLKENIAKARLQIEQFVQTEVDKRRQPLEAKFNNFQQSLMAEMEKVKTNMLSRYQEIEAKKKEVEEKIEAEKNKTQKKIDEESKKLQDKAKDKLKNILKKPGTP